MSLVDVRDIAAIAAAALTDPSHLGKTYDVTGPEAISHDDVAAALSRALGRPVSFNDVPPEAFAEAMSSYGMPRWQVDGLLEDYEHYQRGEAETVSASVREITGHAPRDINAFAHDYASHFAA